MPKIIDDQEKELIKTAMYNKGIMLIREKGLRRITVEDVTNSVGIAKGTFYSYYSSKEEFQYEVVKIAERNIVEKVLAIGRDGGNLRERVIRAFNEIYLASDSIVFYLGVSDIEYLMRKLPNMTKLEAEKSQNNFMQIGDAFGIDMSKTDLSVLSYLMDCLHLVASSKPIYGESGRNQTFTILVEAIADFICNKKTGE